MAGERNLTRTESRGKQRGTEFDDLLVIQDLVTATICRIVVHSGSCLDALTVYYDGQTAAVKHGGNGGGATDIVLQRGEFITKIEGIEDAGGDSISQFTLASNRGRKWGPFGTCQGRTGFSWNAGATVSPELAPNMGLLYFAGSSGNVMGHLRATFATYPGQRRKPDRAVHYEIQSAEEERVQASATLSRFARVLMSPVVTLTVGEAETEFHTNEDVLCRLPFFRAALQTGFKETFEKRITMPEDEPAIVAALLEFLYVGKYAYTYQPQPGVETTMQKIPTAPCDRMEGSFHLRVHATASKYDCQDLANAAMGSLIDILQHLEGIDVIQLLKETYLRGCGIALWAAGGDIAVVKKKLPGILQRVYVTHGKDMTDIVCECPALADDLLRLSVSAPSK